MNGGRGARRTLRTIGTLLWAMLCMTGARAQTTEVGSDRLRLGVKVGVCALQPDLTAIHPGGAGTTVSDVAVHSGVGHTAEVSLRIGIRRVFLQPAVGWSRSESRIGFNLLSASPGAVPVAHFPQSMTLRELRLEAPLVIGCHLVQQSPFQLSLMGGVKMKYNYRVRLTPDTPETSFDFRGDDSPRHWSVCAALEVRIDRLTFDVGYEYGMNSLHADLGAYTYGASTLPPSSMRISRRTSGLSMSVGVMF